MLFILFVVGSCALFTSGWLSWTLWVLFYGSLTFIVCSVMTHWALALRDCPTRQLIDADLFGPNAPYWRLNDLVYPGVSYTPLYPVEDTHV